MDWLATFYATHFPVFSTGLYHMRRRVLCDATPSIVTLTVNPKELWASTLPGARGTDPTRARATGDLKKKRKSRNKQSRKSKRKNRGKRR